MQNTLFSKLIFSVVFVSSLILSIQNPLTVAAAGDGYWHTSGNQILDSNNQVVKIAGINWFGLETASFAPHGLWARSYKDMLDQVKNLGFNAIRLPYSNQALDAGSIPNGIDYSKNPDLKGLSALQIMDKVVDYSGQIGLKIILDQHRPDGNAQSSLWYSSNLSETKWVSDWELLTHRFLNNPTIIGTDLHNEPHENATWGSGDSGTDWKMAATKAGNAILAINPKMLIIIEGVQAYNNQYYWWGGNLTGVKDAPVTLSVPNQVVYSPHDYPSSVNNQSWFSTSDYPNNLTGVWDNTWGYIHKNNIAPVMLGEFGTKLESTSDRQWFETMVKYLKQNQISWTFWSLNPNSGDTGGILNDDWTTVNEEKLAPLKSIQSSLSVATQPVQLTPVPTGQSTPVVSANIPVSVKYTVREQWSNSFVADLTLTNHTNAPVNNWILKWNYSGDQKVVGFWNSNVVQKGNEVTVNGVSWSQNIQPNSSITVGFQGSFNGSNPKPENLVINGQDITQVSTSQPVGPTSTQTTSSSVNNNSINIWWPSHGQPVTGVQPFKAVMSNIDLNQYTMYWQVDNGQLNSMSDSHQVSAHKEALVDVSKWNWRGNGPYVITFTATDKNNNQIGQSSVNLTVAR